MKALTHVVNPVLTITNIPGAATLAAVKDAIDAIGDQPITEWLFDGWGMDPAKGVNPGFVAQVILNEFTPFDPDGTPDNMYADDPTWQKSCYQHGVNILNAMQQDYGTMLTMGDAAHHLAKGKPADVAVGAEHAAFFDAMPCNPRPFLTRMGQILGERGNPGQHSWEYRACLWVVNTITHGQLANVDLYSEWSLLNWCKDRAAEGAEIYEVGKCLNMNVTTLPTGCYTPRSGLVEKTEDGDFRVEAYVVPQRHLCVVND